MSDPSTPKPAARGHRWRGRKMLIVADNSAEGRVALEFACRRAKTTHSRVMLLAVIEPSDFGHWAAVEKKMHDEARQDAEAALFGMAEIVNRVTGGLAEFVIREGVSYEEVKALIDEDHEIRILILGAATGKDGPGPLVSKVANNWGEFPVPVTIVPGNLALEDVEALT